VVEFSRCPDVELTLLHVDSINKPSAINLSLHPAIKLDPKTRHCLSFVWISGLHQTRPHGTWIWHNLEHVSYTKWDIGYPVKPKWRLSTDNRIKRKYRHKRQLHQLQKHQHQRYQRGPKACVLVTANLNWQNRLCNRLIMGVNFICMKNPEVF
ncbi:unnamed protein product, partial [Trichobilharzia regenti]